MSSIFGEKLKISVFGQSHGKAIGMVMDGFPAGFEIDLDELRCFLLRRAPGHDGVSTPRCEEDEPEFLSGIVNGRTCGAPICAVIKNNNTRSADYSEISDIPRPGHADFSARMKYKGFEDSSGGGHFSGRLTAPLCIAGGIAKQYLKKSGITIGAHISRVLNVTDDPFDMVKITGMELEKIMLKPFPVINDTKGTEMRRTIESAKLSGDSVGGIVECAVTGLMPGIGSHMFGGVENRLSSALFGIPAVKGVEFGNGFECAELYGSQNNDPFYIDGKAVKTRTNNHGGVLGGITTGMPLVFRAAFKPTPSITMPQQSVNMKKKTNAELSVHGRHDPAIVKRAVPVVEAVAAAVLCDMILYEG